MQRTPLPRRATRTRLSAAPNLTTGSALLGPWRRCKSGSAPGKGGLVMGAQDSIFFDFNLPNVTTWFYFSLLLAVALFFKFSRLLSMRNLDVVSLFLPVPGLLLLLPPQAAPTWGYAWLMGASGYLLVRCLLDLALVRR